MSAILERWYSERAGKLASPDTAYYAAKHLAAYFTGSVADLTRESLRGYYTAERTKLAGQATRARELTVLRSALHYAKKEGWLPEIPSIPVAPPNPPKERWLSRKEARALIAACDEPHLRLFALLALYTGARTGAILDLTWDRVDLTHNRIDYNPAGRPQTAKRRPTVPIATPLKKPLRDSRKAAGSQFVIEWRGQRVRRVKIGFGLACKRAGLTGVTPHTLRHTAATWMAQAGVPLAAVAAMLGQSIQRTTERYVKHSPEHLRDAVRALESGKVLGRNRAKALSFLVQTKLEHGRKS